MADLFIVKERLKLSLWLVGTGFFGSLLATWYFMRQTRFDGEEGNFYMAAVVTGALALAWVGLLVFFLFAKRVVDPGHHNPGALDRFPWWLVKMFLLVVFIAAMGYGLKHFSRFVEGEFALLRSGDIELLEVRIKMDPALLEKPEGKAGATLVQVAFRENHPRAVAMLLANGATREGLDATGRNPVVASLENLPMLGTLLQAGFDPDEEDVDGVPPIHYAVSLHLADAIEALLGAGAKVDARDAAFRTPLIRVIEADDLPMAGTLLENGADVNAYDRRGDTPLHKAARRRSAAGIRLLLEHGADPRIFNFIHLTPLHIAALGGHDELVSIFLELPDMTG
ncbi:MAG: ankyrin repeat domain-containing protein, partial [Verrucomicrobiota bacterium]|nr:ankyrin repeat domain-containing protein [Verrucomicrobiota bacterium]